MRFRKLRIAWSVAWGVVAVLLIVLWVRSYLVYEVAWCPVFGKHSMIVRAVRGTFEAAFAIPAPSSAGWSYRSSWLDEYEADMAAKSGVAPGGVTLIISQLGLRYSGSITYFAARYIAFVIPAVALTALPLLTLLPHRFSLRTLLIATTLVAVVLGLIVWLSS